MYRAGKDNQAADALTRRDQEREDQNMTKRVQRQQILLQAEKIDPQLQETRLRKATAEENGDTSVELLPIAPVNDLADRLLQANKSCESLQSLRTQATSNPGDFHMQDGLLLYRGRLVVPEKDDLRTLLIREAHDQYSTAHPGRTKTIQLLNAR
ncbi:hypothetical protein K3495_g17447, partial [Podosphaera aphanis]